MADHYSFLPANPEKDWVDQSYANVTLSVYQNSQAGQAGQAAGNFMVSAGGCGMAGASSITMITSAQGIVGPTRFVPVNTFRFLGPEQLFQALISGVILMMKRADIRSIRLPAEQIRSALMEQAGEGYKVGVLGGGPRIFGTTAQHLIGLEPSETVWVEESVEDQTVLVKIVHEHDRIYRTS